MINRITSSISSSIRTAASLIGNNVVLHTTVLSGGRVHIQSRTMGMSPEAKKYKEAKLEYEKKIKTIRKAYIADVKSKLETEEARKRVELERMRAEKRKLLIKKSIRKRRNIARFVRERDEARARFAQYQEEMQKVRDMYDAQQRAKQKYLIDALAQEAKMWITEENIDEKINDHLFEVAGRTTFCRTRYSRNWEYMALPHVPDFSSYSEEDLFDEAEDKYFLTEKSPYNNETETVIPEGHDFYEPGVITHQNKEKKKVDDGNEEEYEEEEDGLIYFEDAVYRPSLVGELYEGKHGGFQISQMPEEELEYVRDLAEKYEELLLSMQEENTTVERVRDENSPKRSDLEGKTSDEKESGEDEDEQSFNPASFENEIEDILESLKRKKK